MPRQAKGPRLWLRRARADGDGYRREAVWLIRDDGGYVESTGFAQGHRGGAEAALQRYIERKHAAAIAASGRRDPARFPVADVLNLYLRDVAAELARPDETAARAVRLGSFFDGRSIADLGGAAIRTYVAARGSPAAARRELEDLRAAVNHARREGLIDTAITFRLPERGPGRERWLTRSEVARLLAAAWRYREKQNLRGTDRFTRRHIARFILVALYTGTRAGAVTGAGFRQTPGRGWIDLERGVFYRRPEGARETKKRRPAVRLPQRLLGHLRRWQRAGARFPVEWNGAPVASIRKAFAAVVADAGLGLDVTPHVLRHTAVTWAMQNNADRYQAGDYFGLSQEMLERRYGHHHPDHLAAVADAIVARPAAERNKPVSGTARAQFQRNETRKLVDLVAEEPLKAADS